ncbi:hypothetical protein SAMN05216174_103128 [Actinokineospora iranica]|uniref:Uncharacterized protein n=1 Tax=Actinokineospora iranica TaxID=1271860 RepID=A0A1G6N0F9_9PSEU|nr:hypothetical protein SAMN05216174_103128 [Actinokineospora iranica]
MKCENACSLDRATWSKNSGSRANINGMTHFTNTSIHTPLKVRASSRQDVDQAPPTPLDLDDAMSGPRVLLVHELEDRLGDPGPDTALESAVRTSTNLGPREGPEHLPGVQLQQSGQAPTPKGVPPTPALCVTVPQRSTRYPCRPVGEEGSRSISPTSRRDACESWGPSNRLGGHANRTVALHRGQWRVVMRHSSTVAPRRPRGIGRAFPHGHVRFQDVGRAISPPPFGSNARAVAPKPTSSQSCRTYDKRAATRADVWRRALRLLTKKRSRSRSQASTTLPSSAGVARRPCLGSTRAVTPSAPACGRRISVE